MSNPANIEHEVADADLLIGAVFHSPAKAPTVVSKEDGRPHAARQRDRRHRDRSGGCIESIRPTSHEKPVYTELTA